MTFMRSQPLHSCKQQFQLLGDDPTSSSFAVFFSVPSLVSFCTASLPIILSKREYTPLLHGFKNNPAYEHLKEKAFAKDYFINLAAKPEYQGTLPSVTGDKSYIDFLC